MIKTNIFLAYVYIRKLKKKGHFGGVMDIVDFLLALEHSRNLAMGGGGGVLSPAVEQMF